MGAPFAHALPALFLCIVAAARADEPPAKPEAPAAAKVQPAAAESKPFEMPPGFRRKKRGGMTLYCRREVVLGSRFQAEKCYDEAGVRKLQLAELEQKEMIERMRACGPGACSIN